MTNILMHLVCLPHIVCFVYYRRTIPEINEDLGSFAGDATIGNFVLQLKKKEYRNVFLSQTAFCCKTYFEFLFTT